MKTNHNHRNGGGSILQGAFAATHLTSLPRPLGGEAVAPSLQRAKRPKDVSTRNPRVRKGYTFKEAAVLLGTSPTWIGRFVKAARLDAVARFWVDVRVLSQAGISALRYERERAARLSRHH